MNETNCPQTSVTFPAIGCYALAFSDIYFCEENQFIATASANDLHAQQPQFANFTLKGNRNFAFMTTALTSFADLFATKVKLYGLNTTRKLLSVGKDRVNPKLLQPAPGCLVTLQSTKLLQTNSINARLTGRKPLQVFEPNCQGLLIAMKNSTGGYLMLVLTFTAYIKSSIASPEICMATTSAYKALGPSKIKKKLLLIAESTIKFNLVLRKCFFHDWSPLAVWRPA